MLDETQTITSLPEAPKDDSQDQPESTESQESVVQQPQPPKESSEERNFRALREKAERIQRERDEALIRLKQFEDAQRSESESLNLGPDDLAEGKHLNKVQKQIKDLETQVQEARLRARYPDIDKVVNSDNLALLKQEHPEVASIIGASKDMYSQAVTAYTMIKKLGILQDDSSYGVDKALAQKNAAKPRPLASVSPQQGDSPLSKANAFANGLTDELKKQLHRETMEAIKNR
jgi:hypothetical protein